MVMNRQCLIPAFGLLLSGCFSYLPVSTDAVSKGESVRIRITPGASDRIAPLLGASSARQLTGTIVSTAADQLIVEVPIVVRDTREFGSTPFQRVTVHRPELVELEIRRLDRFRTTALVGGAAVIVVGTLIKALRGEPGKDKLPGGDPGAESLIPAGRSWP